MTYECGKCGKTFEGEPASYWESEASKDRSYGICFDCNVELEAQQQKDS